MKFYYLFFSILFLNLTSENRLSAQTFHIQENFNAGSLPAGWIDSTLSGTAKWQFGIDGSFSDAGNNNIDNSNFVYFDDNFLGSSASNNKPQLSTPAFNNSLNSTTFLKFDYNFREEGNIPGDSLYVEVFDGTNWVYIWSVKTDDCGRYTQTFGLTACQSNGFPSASIDISAFANTNCRVRFIYSDGSGWGWYAALDNVEIYSSVVTGIIEQEFNQDLFTLYPNPNQGEFTLEGKQELIGSHFEVYNMSGQLVLQERLIHSKMKLNLSEYGKGMYFIRFPSQNRSTKVLVY